MFSRNRSALKRISLILAERFKAPFLNLADVGAAGGIDARWEPFRELVRVVGFEPSKEQFSKLKPSAHELWINTALAGSSGSRPIYLTKYWSNISLLPPNSAVIKELAFGDGHEITGTAQVDCQTLAEVATEHDLQLDVLKVDTQGTELEILRGAAPLLPSLVAVEAEVEFVPLYTEQPLFADVDRELRSHGFDLQDLGNILYLKPRAFPTTGGPKGRIISADVLYIRAPSSAPDLCRTHGETKIAALLVTYLAYGYPELCRSALASLREAGMSQPWHVALDDAAASIRHPSQTLSWLPGLSTLARGGRLLWRLLYPFHSSLWDQPLGNKLH